MENNITLPINSSILFTDRKGREKKSLQKNMTKLLLPFQPFLESILRPGETIQYVAHASSPSSFFELYTMGAAVVYLKRCLLVFTDQRVLHLPATWRHKPRNIVAEIALGDINWGKKAFFGFKFSYKDGTAETFSHMRSRDFKKIATFLPEKISGKSPTEAKHRRHLCPRCFKPLEKDKYICMNCRLEFKNMDTAKKVSLLYPGGGYFYTGHPFLGLGDAVVELFLIVVVVTTFLEALKDSGAWVGVILFGVFLAIEKALSVYHAKHFIKEYIPLQNVAS